MGIFRRKDDNDIEDDAIPSSEIEELRSAVQEAGLPPSSEKAVLKEVDKLGKISMSSAEYAIGMNYIEYILSLPWNKHSDDILDIRRAESILNREHFGLDEIKDRILEYLAVRILRGSRKNRILVVDDEEMTRMNLDHVLTKEGYIVHTASNGREALAAMDEHEFDIVITDLKMDKVDGMEVLENTKTRSPSPAVIIITGYATVSSAVTAMRKGSFHYISKPFKLDEIRDTVKMALAGRTLRLESRGPILCFVGPPGTGKTSLGQSIADSLGKKFIRISLAGVKDEAEIRGHRRSYVGALPGRIIREIRRVEVVNPVFMLDELDKIGQDFKGDPAAALLEVLDPEQNKMFVDNYLDMPFDLSDVMFIATANTVDPIPGPLRDRLEVLQLSGYTEREKVQIAFNYLIPRAVKESGLLEDHVEFTPEGVKTIISEYSREAGLRNLQRQIETICRKIVRESLGSETGDAQYRITPELAREYLGARRYHFEIADADDRIGVATGLAWTETGGELVFVEATKMKGRGKLILTGSLGDVMKESAQAALSYIRSNTEMFGIADDFFDTLDLHLHVPAGAVPKDGPSAGLTIAVALFSLLSDRPARKDVALSGELTLSGRVLPVGGIKEKVLAAHRAGVRTVVFPRRNDLDIKSLPEEVMNDVHIILIDELPEIKDLVLVNGQGAH